MPLMYFYLHPSQSIYNVKILLINLFFVLIGFLNVLFSNNPEMPFQTVLMNKKFLKHIKQSCLKVMVES